MCGHKGTKIYICTEVFVFFFTSLLLPIFGSVPGALIQFDPSGPRDTSRRAINKTENIIDFILTTLLSVRPFFVSGSEE